MAKRQTRRTISINGRLFEDSKQRAAQWRVPHSALTEYALRKVLELETQPDIPIPSVERALESRAAGMIRATARIQPPSRSRMAALLVRETGCTVQAAASRFGLTRQAVDGAMRRAIPVASSGTK